MSKDIYKHPRLYLNARFAQNGKLIICDEQNHYIKNVLRMKQGDKIRVFNGYDGEYLAEIISQSKKESEIALKEKLKEQPDSPQSLALYFAPIKNTKMGFLIEKAVELGVSDFYPVITQRTENRKFNEARIQNQIIEAAEQCERLDIPAFHEMQGLDSLISTTKTQILAAIERTDATPLSKINPENERLAFLIGPEGGFTPDEIKLLQTNKNFKSVSLGENILRAETAAIAALAWARLSF